MKTQGFDNHARYFPIFHFVAVPVLAGNVGIHVVRLFQDPSLRAAGVTAVALAILLGVLGSRVMALKVQDRVIRLEMRLRLAHVLPQDLQAVIPELRTRHLVALRFASDAELPDLVRRVVAGELTEQKEIKRAVTDWQADWLRA